jgi:hypothetical protein
MPIVLMVVFVGGGDIRAALGQGGKPVKKQAGGEMPIRIEVRDDQGLSIASTDIQAPSSTVAAAALTFHGEYRPGDRIVITGPRRMAVRLDDSMTECLLYLPNPSRGKFSYEIPYGREERQTGSAYASESFSGNSHRVTARALNLEELTGYRNLALNPCDLLQPEDGPAQVYPHSSTNSYARNLYDFAARNAIDGNVQNGRHGVWPYQSWGPEQRLDLWWKLDFGRPVELDKIRLVVRADFPHDSYWKSADLEFSDGSRLPIRMIPSAEFQEFAFPRWQVSWVRITNLVPADPAKWCSFIEVEAWGRDLP